MAQHSDVGNGSVLEDDPLRDTTFGAILPMMRKRFYFRWTWDEDEIQGLVAEGWDRIGEGDLRFTFNTGRGHEHDVNVFAAAYEQFRDAFESPLLSVPGRRPSATWIRSHRLVVLTPYQVRIINPETEGHAAEIDEATSDNDAPAQVCGCHCHCAVKGLDYCHDDDCGAYDEHDDDDYDEDDDAEEDDCDDEQKRCGECHCCTCWKNCGCDFYSSEVCGCGCHVCVCDCFNALLEVDNRPGDDEPVEVPNEWPAFVAGLARALTRLGKGDGLDLKAHRRRFARFQVRDHDLECTITGKRGVPQQFHLTTEQRGWLVERGWENYRDFGQTYTLPFASGYDEYVVAAEAVATVLRDFLGIARPAELGIEATAADGAPSTQPPIPLVVTA
ncbi:TY-Chap domain-containing protein [Nocardia sp. NPDC055321]